MKNVKEMFSNLKSYNNEILLKEERITIVNKNRIFIQNYQDVIEIKDDLIVLTNIIIKGNNLKILSISKYFLEITGTILNITFERGKNK